mmetsp:Transcript_104798/g.165452  ORF Transcript_104798/g.165452 Transcript_104798/m.165452 type:complete len:601 (+) Transcript_104798:90-1892(+)|eukprot:CAMPEP_0169077214 /NCGR_PEP_ID=MMETSP1015-20121227/8759_1 /TAXON_ID=342587 /ORGANISM="Karlodinium micrum, Strain CCMP2283" /LENGTH=600 /DNA_ID=CAMNT_0009136723 /DNA_START=1858 /DNA_END=3660 /DNA_ORIENTATION=-
MKLIAVCEDMKLEIPVGAGKQHVRWLGLVVATRMQREKYPHAFRVPQRVLARGELLKARAVISEVLADGEEFVVELRQGATIPEDWFDDNKFWIEEAYGKDSNLMECKFRWKASQGLFPESVRGYYTVNYKWNGVYPQRDYGGQFEIPLESIPLEDGNYDWIATRKGPPGTCNYKFVMGEKEGGAEVVCKASPETLSKDGSHHEMQFFWDVPTAPEPYPEIDSRPSTASSRDGAQVDPRFEQDWEAMRLRWIESFMKVRVKDVLTEFYAILIDLFDSYAFMGLDLSASQHTIGMDDWKHLVINCGLLRGQPNASLPWREICTWFEEAAGVKDGRPYLGQRLSRAHYLELLMRTAGWTMCVHPKEPYAPEPGRPPMPLDEGLFRFITDILIPVMDVYDDDPIRKDAVQHQNLIVIQQNRPSIRSIYAALAQPSPSYDGENVLLPKTLKHIFEFVQSILSEAEKGGPPPATTTASEDEKKAEGEVKPPGVDFVALLTGEDKLSLEQVDALLESFDATVANITEKHPEPLEERILLFWEFFEVLMQCCRELVVTVGTPLHEGIPAFVATALAMLQLVDSGEVQLPEPFSEEGAGMLGEEPLEA